MFHAHLTYEGGMNENGTHKAVKSIRPASQPLQHHSYQHTGKKRQHVGHQAAGTPNMLCKVSILCEAELCMMHRLKHKCSNNLDLSHKPYHTSSNASPVRIRWSWVDFLSLFYVCDNAHINTRKTATTEIIAISKSPHFPIARKKPIARMLTETEIRIKNVIANTIKC